MGPEFIHGSRIVPDEYSVVRMRTYAKSASWTVFFSGGLEVHSGKRSVWVRKRYGSEHVAADNDLPVILVRMLQAFPGLRCSGIQVKPSSKFIGLDLQRLLPHSILSEPYAGAGKTSIAVTAGQAKINILMTSAPWMNIARMHKALNLQYFTASANFRHKFYMPLDLREDAESTITKFYSRDIEAFANRLESLIVDNDSLQEFMFRWKPIADGQRKQMLEALNELDEAADEMGIVRPSSKLKSATRDMLLRIWEAIPADYYVFPRSDGSISVSASIGAGHAFGLLCRQDGTVTAFLSRDGQNDHEHYESADALPNEFAFDAMKPLSSEQVLPGLP